MPIQQIYHDYAVYVSYAWGEEGDEREEIVNALCKRLEEQKICVVGRDKKSMKTGESISEFARLIATSPLLIAVISAKYLRSYWCMIHEFFPSYMLRKKGGNQDVIYLILDDAKDDVCNPEREHEDSVINHWTKSCGDQRVFLDKARHNNHERGSGKSPESDSEHSDIYEMIEHLPDMLLSIKRVNMPRGFAPICRDEFSEICELVRQKLENNGFASSISRHEELRSSKTLYEYLHPLAKIHDTLVPPKILIGALQFALDRVLKQNLEAIFPGLLDKISTSDGWSQLLKYFKDPAKSDHLDDEQIKSFVDIFEENLLHNPKRALPSGTRPVVALLVDIQDDKKPRQVIYRCRAVLRFINAAGKEEYMPILSENNHFLVWQRESRSVRSSSFNPETPLRAGEILGRLWSAALVQLDAMQGVGEPIIDLYLPKSLLQKDWSSIKLIDTCGKERVLHTLFYRLRSFDRWSDLSLRFGAEDHFKIKHDKLQKQEGQWHVFDTGHRGRYDSISLSRSDSATVAVLYPAPPGVDLKKFLDAAVQSWAPVVCWWCDSQAPCADACRNLTIALDLNPKVLDPEDKQNTCPFNLSLDDLAIHRRDRLPPELRILLEDLLPMDPHRPNRALLFQVADGQAMSSLPDQSYC